MSLYIDTEHVTRVLLADGWHEARSFELDSYEFASGEEVIHEGGQSGVCATGFQFISGGRVLCGPMTAILAVEVRADGAVLKKAR
jgi:hypothetical protein